MIGESSRVAVLFVDLTDSVGLYARHGDRAAFELITTCLGVVESGLREAGVRAIKRLGDAVLALAPSPDDALRGALRAKDLVRDHPNLDEVLVRAGISFGSAVLTEGDVYGDIVNVAARLISLAKGGEILLAEDAREGLSPALRESTRSIQPQVLRGRKLQSAVYEYLGEAPDITRATSGAGAARAATLELHFGAERRWLRLGGVLRIGRADDNDIVVADDVVSRHHAVIAPIAHEFVLTDRSTNGTYVRTASGERYYAQRSQVTLAGQGEIFAGAQTLPPIGYRVHESS